MSDTTELASTSGAFAPKAWERASRSDLINGVEGEWTGQTPNLRPVRYDGPPVLLGFAAEDIDGVEKQAGGFNLIVNVYAEIKDEKAVFTMVAPRGRMKQLWAFLGRRL